MRAEKDDRFRAVMKAAEEQGWLVEMTSKKHWKFVPPHIEGRPVFFSGSPGDWRALRNFIAALRRHGFRPPSKFRR